MDINLAALAPSLTRTAPYPEWQRHEDRYYARMSIAWPSLASVQRLLAVAGAGFKADKRHSPSRHLATAA